MTSHTKQTLLIFWQHAKKYPKHIFAVMFLLVVSVAAETAGPFLYKQFINILASYNTSRYRELITILTIIIAMRAIRSYSYRVKDYFAVFLQSRVMSDLTNTCFNYLHFHSYNFFANSFVGSLVTKVKRYERSFETLADRITDDFMRTFLAIVFVVIVLSYESLLLGFAVLVWCIIYILSIYFFSLYKLKYDLKKAAVETKLTGVLADTITNNSNIKLFSSFSREKKTFEKVTDEHFKIRKFSWDLMVYLETLQGTLMLGLEFLMMYLAIRYWRAGKLSVGDFTLIQLYLLSIFDKLWNMGKHIRAFYEALADANEMTEILLSPHEVQDLPGAKDLQIINSDIEFKNVNFGYFKENLIFANFSLKIKEGERLALIGPSGGGKSTIVKLLFRFHDISGGEILIDGQNISEVTQDSLRNALSLVPQDPILFHRSLMENIRYGKPKATNEEVIEASKLAHCHEFISSFNDGYNTLVGERGIKLSGGERQRVAIARAILKNAPILVLDEATSSLDSESERYIQDALTKLMSGSASGGKDKTVIVIAHRLSTIMQMDRIVVIDGGQIKEQGKHKELLKIQEGTYQKLWKIQAGGFSTI